jgi:DNA invertase Pin-like site-specific DNA recombinase
VSVSPTPKRVAIYCRVSTDGQTVENQLQTLQESANRHEWNIVAVHKDEGISGAKGRDKRPGLDALMKGVARKEFDLVAVWSVDRMGRSLQDLLAVLDEIHAKGIDLYIHQQGIDTTTPGGRALFQMLGVFSEFERAMIRDRVNAGLNRARAQGKQLGRPRVSEEIEQAIREARNDGKGIRKIAQEVGCGVATVQRVLKAS